MHAAVKIDSGYYDAQGKKQKSKLIATQAQIMRSDFERYINKNGLNNEVYQHVLNQTEVLPHNECVTMNNFSKSKYDNIYNYCKSEIQKLKRTNELSKDKSKSRDSDF